MNNGEPISDRKYLTRYTREKTTFEGWRVCISKRGRIFTKYLSDREFGGEEGSYEAARALRDEILECFKHAPEDDVLVRFQKKFARKPRS